MALVFRTDLDNPGAADLARLPDSVEVVTEYNAEMKQRRQKYDMVLIGSFVVLVAGALAATFVAKMRKVGRALWPDELEDDDHIAMMKRMYMRLRLGLATDLDIKMLAEYIGDLDHNEHVRAGKRLWRGKQMVAHLDTAHMSTMLAQIEEQLPKSERLGYHFTDLDAARVIMDQSQGLRTSAVGQLGGGVSICLGSLIELGWEQHGNAGEEFTKKVGEELWGSKWYEAIPGTPWPDLEQQIQSGKVNGTWPDARDHWGDYHNKLEVVFVVRIPEKMDKDRIVPGRSNVYIVPATDCVPGPGKDTASYYSNLNIEKCLVLKSPSSDNDRAKLESYGAEEQGVRVQCVSGRDRNHGMIDVGLREEVVAIDE